ncbi:zinc-dependent alcohol dehydrogenase [Schlesneria sp. DSM 10557]|uniref:zinc-dependent alcohol dehydrogenase n=1 Tax=Schlesneria sp. DSM 10557 TaxID=3044399 RepID=UPI00359FC33F
MQAVVFHGVGDVRLETVGEPKIKEPTDVIVRLVASAICGTDLHMIRGTMPGMVPGTILGHEGVGIVEEVGSDVVDMQVGDRVVIPSTIACGHCSYCETGYHSQCDNANPHGKQAGTAFFGGPATTGPFDGLQAEFARVPLADAGLVKLPENVSDDQAILISDIFPTGYFAADIAEIKPGDSVAVYGCGPVGLFSIASAKLMRAGKIFAIDSLPDRLAAAEKLGAIPINFNEADPVNSILSQTNGIGALRVIDAVGVDAVAPEEGLIASWLPSSERTRHREQVAEVAPRQRPDGDNWIPGNAPSQVLDWAVKSIAKAGTLSIVGVYPQTAQFFNIGIAMNKNITIQMGNCPHRKYLPKLVEMVSSQRLDPLTVLPARHEPLTNVLQAYKEFDKRNAGWIKVELNLPVTA